MTPAERHEERYRQWEPEGGYAPAPAIEPVAVYYVRRRHERTTTDLLPNGFLELSLDEPASEENLRRLVAGQLLVVGALGPPARATSRWESLGVCIIARVEDVDAQAAVLHTRTLAAHRDLTDASLPGAIMRALRDSALRQPRLGLLDALIPAQLLRDDPSAS